MKDYVPDQEDCISLDFITRDGGDDNFLCFYLGNEHTLGSSENHLSIQEVAYGCDQTVPTDITNPKLKDGCAP